MMHDYNLSRWLLMILTIALLSCAQLQSSETAIERGTLEPVDRGFQVAYLRRTFIFKERSAGTWKAFDLYVGSGVFLKPCTFLTAGHNLNRLDLDSNTPKLAKQEFLSIHKFDFLKTKNLDPTFFKVRHEIVYEHSNGEDVLTVLPTEVTHYEDYLQNPQSQSDLAVIRVKKCNQSPNVKKMDVTTRPAQQGEELLLVSFGPTSRDSEDIRRNSLSFKVHSVSKKGAFNQPEAPQPVFLEMLAFDGQMSRTLKGDSGGAYFRRRSTGDYELAGLHIAQISESNSQKSPGFAFALDLMHYRNWIESLAAEKNR